MQYAQLVVLALITLALGCQSSALTAAKLYLQQEEPQKAKDQLVLALETEPQNAEAHFLLGKSTVARATMPQWMLPSHAQRI